MNKSKMISSAIYKLLEESGISDFSHPVFIMILEDDDKIYVQFKGKDKE